MKHVNMKILGVYNANSGVVGEVIYFLGKLSGATHCAFCDITHSYFVKKTRRLFYFWINIPYQNLVVT